MRFIDEHSHLFAVALLLRVLNIAESTYYQWVRRAEQASDRDLVDLGLISNIHEIWEASRCTYGAPGLQHVRDRRESDPVIDAVAPATLMAFRVHGQQRRNEMPQRLRAVLLHITHARTTNDAGLQQPPNETRS